MKVDFVTFALILSITNFAQAILIYGQSNINKKYKGIRTFAMGSVAFTIGFLLMLLHGIISYNFVTVVLGNALLMAALIIQYIGLMLFLEIKKNLHIMTTVFIIAFVLLFYFNIKNNIVLILIITNIAGAILSFYITFSFSKNRIKAISKSLNIVGVIFLLNGILKLFQALMANFTEVLQNLLNPILLQVILYSGELIITLLITFGFIYIIYKRLSSEICTAKEHFEQIFNLSPDITLITGFFDGLIIDFNKGFLDISGYNREEVKNKTIYDLELYEFDFMRQVLLNRLNEDGFVKNYEVEFHRKNGTTINCVISAEKIIMNDSPHIISIIHDVTDRKKAEDELKISEEKYRFLTEFVSDVIWVYNFTKKIFTYVSPSVFQLRGFTAEEAMKEKLEEVLTPESLSAFLKFISNSSKDFLENPKNSMNYITEIQNICKNGDVIWVEISIKYKLNADKEIEILGVSRNIDKRKQVENQVLYLSYHDQLTGLYNTRYYEEQLKKMDTKRNLPLAVIMADVNGLKLTNDAFGHKTGDFLLEKVADILKNECTEDEIIARTGGDEFIILSPETNDDEVKKIIGRINKSLVNQKFNTVILSVSIGYDIKYKISEDFNEVIKKAEDDMYRHKLSESSVIKDKTIEIIKSKLYEKDSNENRHAISVSELCESLAKEIGLDAVTVQEVKKAGLMHDIGKIGIDEAILNSNPNLTNKEWNGIRRHPEIGYRILSSANEYSKLADYVLEHHERWDGKGYPMGLKGENISLQARIISVADAFDAMTSDRNYKTAKSEEDAVKELQNNVDKQFDAHVVDIFVHKVLPARGQE